MYYFENKVTLHEKKAQELFLSGYNCAQSVFAAFSDLTGIPEAESAALASSFGGGMCGLRDTCGAVSGMLMALGRLVGYSDPADHAAKTAQYELGRTLAREFAEVCSSTVCRELLEGIKLGEAPAVRDAQYYKIRPCARFCGVAAHLVDNYLETAGNA